MSELSKKHGRIRRDIGRLVIWIFVAMGALFPVAFGAVAVLSGGRFLSLPLGLLLLIGGGALMVWGTLRAVAENRRHINQVRDYIRGHPEAQLCTPWELSGDLAMEYGAALRQQRRTAVGVFTFIAMAGVGVAAGSKNWEARLYVPLMGLCLLLAAILLVLQRKQPPHFRVCFHPEALLIGDQVYALSLWGRQLRKVSIAEDCLIWQVTDADKNSHRISLPIPPDKMTVARELLTQYNQ